jgi:hypothetical protein
MGGSNISKLDGGTLPVGQGGDVAPAATQGGEANAPAVPANPEQVGDGTAGSGYVQKKAAFETYLSDRFTSIAGRQNYYTSGLPQEGTSGGSLLVSAS